MATPELVEAARRDFEAAAQQAAREYRSTRQVGEITWRWHERALRRLCAELEVVPVVQLRDLDPCDRLLRRLIRPRTRTRTKPPRSVETL